MIEGKKVVLDIGSVEFEFEVTLGAYNEYLDAIKMDVKVAPALNFVRRCLKNKELRPALDDFCNQGLTMDIAGLLMEEFRPKVEVVVKK